MGCLQSSEKKEAPEAVQEDAPKKLDPRLPFESYRQFFNLKNSWKSITRKLEDTAKDNLARFLKAHPEHKKFHKDLLKYDDEEKMLASTAFENASMGVYNTFDMAMEKMDGSPDDAISSLQRAGRMHSKIKDFDPVYFKDMEDSFIEANKEVLQERFTEATDKNFRLLFQFACEQMTEGYNKTKGNQAAKESNRI